MERDTDVLWEKILSSIKSKVTDSNFKTWFVQSKLVEISDAGAVRIGFPNELMRRWVREKYLPVVSESVRECISDATVVECVIFETKKRKERVSRKKVIENKLPLSENKVQKESNLNKRYTFENFIQTPHNTFARGAGEAVINNPGSAHNPLFVYGTTGVGKTHLIQSIGNALVGENPMYKVLYVTSEQFRDEFLEAVSNNSSMNNTIKRFKDRYTSCDALIIDDIQFLAAHRGMQTREQLHHIFNALHNKNKQIIFSSDEHPRKLDGFRTSMVSRFEFGITIEIQPIDAESKKILMEKLIVMHNIFVDEEIKKYMLEHCEPDIRSIEGKIKQIGMYKTVYERDITIDDFRKIIAQSSSDRRKRLSPKDVTKQVSRFYNIPVDAIFQQNRKQNFVMARQIVMYILREDLNLSYSTIGQSLNRDHTTVIHSCERIKESLSNGGKVSQDLMQIRSGLNIV